MAIFWVFLERKEGLSGFIFFPHLSTGKSNPESRGPDLITHCANGTPEDLGLGQ